MREAARRFGVAVTIVKLAVVQQRETGRSNANRSPAARAALGRTWEPRLQARLEAAPDATVEEHCAWWQEHQGQELTLPHG